MIAEVGRRIEQASEGIREMNFFSERVTLPGTRRILRLMGRRCTFMCGRKGKIKKKDRE